MFLSGCNALQANTYMLRLRKCVNMMSSRDRSHLHGLAWLRRYELKLIGGRMHQHFQWSPTGLCPIVTLQELEGAFTTACFP